MMSLRQLIRLVHPGVTRVFVAGRRAGGTWLGVRVVVESAIALLIALRVSAAQADRQNAIRHFIWQSRLVLAGDEAFASRVGDLQEEGSPAPVDSEVDQRNNAAARSYLQAHRQDFAHLGTVSCFRELTRVALDQWAQGKLWTAEDGRVVPSGSTRDE